MLSMMEVEVRLELNDCFLLARAVFVLFVSPFPPLRPFVLPHLGFTAWH